MATSPIAGLKPDANGKLPGQMGYGGTPVVLTPEQQRVQASQAAQLAGGASGQAATQAAGTARDQAVRTALQSQGAQNYTFVDDKNIDAQAQLNQKYGLAPSTGFTGIPITPESATKNQTATGEQLMTPDEISKNSWSTLTPPQVPVPTGNPKVDEAAQRNYQSQLNAYSATVASRQKAAQDSAFSGQQARNDLKFATEKGVIPYESAPKPTDYATEQDYLIASQEFQKKQYAEAGVTLPDEGFDWGTLFDMDNAADEAAFKDGANAYDVIAGKLERLGFMQLGLNQTEYSSILSNLKERSKIAEDEKAIAVAEAQSTKAQNLSLIEQAKEVQLKANELEKARSAADYDEQLTIAKDNRSRLEGFMKGKMEAMGIPTDSTAGLEMLSKYASTADLGIARLERDKQDAQMYYAGQSTKIMQDYANNVFTIEHDYTAKIDKANLDARKEINTIEANKLSSLSEKNNQSLAIMKDLFNTRLSIEDKKKSEQAQKRQEAMEAMKFQYQVSKDAVEQANWQKTFNQGTYEFNKSYELSALRANLDRYEVKEGIDANGYSYTYTVDKLGGVTGYNSYTNEPNVSQNPYSPKGVVGLSGAKVGDYGGQCGYFTRITTGVRVGDSYASKVEMLDKNGRLSAPVAGSVFVMPTGGTSAPYGHIGIVASTGQDKKGKYIMALDSNWNNNEKIDLHKIYTSQIEKDGGGYTAPKTGSIANLFKAGADLTRGAFDVMGGNMAGVANIFKGGTDMMKALSRNDRNVLDKFSPEVKSWASLVKSGFYKPSEIPAKLKPYVGRYITLSGGIENKAEVADLPAGAQSEYRSYNQIYQVAAPLLAEIEANKNTSTGIYAKFLNDSRKYVDLEQDTSYADVIEKSQLAQAAYRHFLLGANQTITESDNAKFFVQPDDKAKDVVRKLKNLSNYGKMNLDILGQLYGVAESPNLTMGNSPVDNYINQLGY